MGGGGEGGSHDLKWSNSTGASQVGFLSPRIWQGWKIFFFLLLESSAVFDGFIFFLLIWILYNRDAYTRVFFSLTEAKWDWEAESCQERALVKPAASQIPGRWNPRTGVGGMGGGWVSKCALLKLFLQRQLCCCLVCFISVFVSSFSSIIFCILSQTFFKRLAVTALGIILIYWLYMFAKIKTEFKKRQLWQLLKQHKKPSKRFNTEVHCCHVK